jgi:hypothetical protein
VKCLFGFTQWDPLSIARILEFLSFIFDQAIFNVANVDVRIPIRLVPNIGLYNASLVIGLQPPTRETPCLRPRLLPIPGGHHDGSRGGAEAAPGEKTATTYVVGEFLMVVVLEP